MTDSFVQPEGRLSWRFPRIFWIANGTELFERAAYYGMFIALAVYLTDVVGFGDVGAGYVAAFLALWVFRFVTNYLDRGKTI